MASVVQKMMQDSRGEEPWWGWSFQCLGMSGEEAGSTLGNGRCNQEENSWRRLGMEGGCRPWIVSSEKAELKMITMTLSRLQKLWDGDDKVGGGLP